MLSLSLLAVFLFSVNIGPSSTVNGDELEVQSLGYVDIDELFSSIKFNKDHYDYNDDVILEVELGEHYGSDVVVERVRLRAESFDMGYSWYGEKTGDKTFQFKQESISTMDKLYGVEVSGYRNDVYFSDSYYGFDSEYSYTTDLKWMGISVGHTPIERFYKNIQTTKQIRAGETFEVSFQFANFWDYEKLNLIYVNKSTNKEVVIPVEMNIAGQLTGKLSPEMEGYAAGSYILDRITPVGPEAEWLIIHARNQLFNSGMMYFGTVDMKVFDFDIIKTIPVEKLEENIAEVGKDFDLETADSIINVILEMPESKEKEGYLEAITAVMKEQKIVNDFPDKEIIKVTEGLFENIRMPEVLDKDVKAVEVRIEAKALTKEEVLHLQIKSRETEKTLLVYDMSLMKNIIKTDGTETLSEIDNADIKAISISVPVPEEYNDIENLVMAFVDDDGNVTLKESVVTVVDGKRILTFVTDHFSYYALMETTEEVTVPEEEVSDNPIEETDTHEVVEEVVTTPVVEKEEVVSEEDKSDIVKETETEKLPEAGNASSMIFIISGIGSSLTGWSILRRKK